jgi:hypothetical protein
MGLLQTLGNIGSGLSSVLNPLSAGMSIVGTLGGLFGANEDRKMQQRINDQNIQMQRETNANQMQMARDANKLQENMMYANMAWQQEQADRQWQRETEWNDIGSQMKRAAAAGVNPFVALGKGNVGNIAGQMSTPGASSAGISPAVPNLTAPRAEMIQGKWSRTAELINAMSNSVAALSSAGKSNVEAKRTQTLMTAELQSLLADARKTNTDADMQEMQMAFELLYGNERRSKELVNLAAQTEVAIRQASMLASQKEDVDVQKQLHAMQAAHEKIKQLLTLAQTKLTDEQFQLVEKEVLNYDTKLQADLKVKRSEAFKNTEVGKLQGHLARQADAAADKAIAETKTIDALRDWQVAYAVNQNNEKFYDSQKKEKELHYLSKQLKEQLRNQKIINDQQEALMEKYIQEGEWAMFEKLVNNLKLGFDTVGSFFNAAGQGASYMK